MVVKCGSNLMPLMKFAYFSIDSVIEALKGDYHNPNKVFFCSGRDVPK